MEEQSINENAVQPPKRGRKTTKPTVHTVADPMDRTIDRAAAEEAAGGPTALDAMVDAELVRPAKLRRQTWYDRPQIEAALPILAAARACSTASARSVTMHALAICRLAGCRLDDLAADRDGQTPEDVNARSMRVIALGLVVRLGRDLGIQWRCLHGEASEVAVLRPVHYASIQRAYKRALAFVESGGAAGQAIERGYRQIQRRALADIEDAAQRKKHKSGKKSSSAA